MAACFEIGRGPAESKHQKVAETALRSVEIVRWIKRTQDVVGWDLPVERGDQAVESVRADYRVDLLFFHPPKFY
jgi:hypothetical protein